MQLFAARLVFAIVLECLVTQLVSILKVAILLAVLLNGIVGQVSEHVVWILRVYVIGHAGCSQVALLEQINFAIKVPKNPTPNVKFSAVNQKRSLNILLENERIVLHSRVVG